MQKRWYLYTYLSTDIFDGFIYKKRVILIPGSVKKQLGSGSRFWALMDPDQIFGRIRIQ